MTESTFPFGSVEQSTATDQPEGTKRRLVLGLGALAGVAFAGAAFFLLGADSSAEQVTLAAAPRPPGVAAAAPAAAPAAPQTLPAQHDETKARNPFEAKYIEPPPPPPPPPPAPVAAPVDQSLPLPLPLPGGPTVTSGSATGSTMTGTVGTAPTTGTPSDPPTVDYPITLKSIGDAAPEVRVVTWTVDGKRIEVIPGQRFGRFGELVVLAYTNKEGTTQVSGVVLQVGDAMPLTVSIGETVHVQ